MPSAAAKPGGPSSIPALASPNVVLLPGGSASARVDVIKTDSCLQADRLTISLPGDASIYDLPFAIPMCGLRINPVVPGVTGSN